MLNYLLEKRRPVKLSNNGFADFENAGFQREIHHGTVMWTKPVNPVKDKHRLNKKTFWQKCLEIMLCRS